MKQKSVVEMLLAAMVVVVAVGFLIFAYTSTRASSLPEYELTAKMAHADGLNSGSNVELAGLKVGSVLDVALAPKGYVVILHIRIRNDLKIPKNFYIIGIFRADGPRFALVNLARKKQHYVAARRYHNFKLGHYRLFTSLDSHEPA